MKKFYSLTYFLAVCLLLGTTNLYAQTENLVAWWNFDDSSGETTTDVIGGFTGTLNGPFFDTESHEGFSLLFDGLDDYVATDLMEEIHVASNLTIMAWFNTKTLEGQQHILWIGDAAGNGWGEQQEINLSINHFHGDYQSGQLTAFYGSSADTETNNINIVSEETNVTLETWHHAAVVFENMDGLDDFASGKLYLDGQLLTPVDWSTTETGFGSSDVAGAEITRDLWNTPLYIGIGGTLSRGFNGFIDDVKIYDIAMVQSEIMAAMENPTYLESNRISNANFVYPNPVINTLYINSEESFHSVEIYDMQGKQVLRTSRETQIDVSGLSKGIYMIKLINNDESLIQKIVVE